MSVGYWDSRYRQGKGSGPASTGAAAKAKAELVQAVIDRHGVTTVVDWGVGDGRVAQHLTVARYLAVDVSPVALRLARNTIGARPGWSWWQVDPVSPPSLPFHADLALSLDVIFHLVDDAAYERHIVNLFGSADRVLVRATNYDSETVGHMRHHQFTRDVPDGWELVSGEGDGPGYWEFAR